MTEPTRQLSCTLVLVAALAAAPHTSRAAEPLHVHIDQLVEAGQVSPLAAVTTDTDFLRRIYLDLTGTIPSTQEVRAFLADPSPEKRVAAIDRLLASPAYVRHMMHSLDVMLMERRTDKHVPGPEWQKFLYDSVASNKPWDQLVREILSADGTDAATRPAAKFYLDRDVEPNLLTRDIGRIFFGRDLQCAQCHHHPLIDDYLQDEYHGLLAFISRSSLFTPKDQKPCVADKAEGDVAFESVFTGRKAHTKPRLPGALEIAEPATTPGDEYTVKPADGVRPVPKYSRRLQLAKEATAGTNQAFSRNIANRLWAHMMGRGLVHPVDLHHSDNPASHPAVLELLAGEFVAMKFDMRAMLRELALTRTYQRSIDLPAQPGDIAAIDARLASIEAERKQATDGVSAAAANIAKINEQLEPAEKSLLPLYDERAKAIAAAAPARTAALVAAQTLATSQVQLAAKQEASTLVTDALTKIQAALAKLPGDANLTQAAAVFQARTTTLAAETAALAQTVETQFAASTAAAAAQKIADDAVAGIDNQLEAARQPIDALRTQLLLANAQLERERTTANYRQQIADELTSATAVVDAAANAQVSRANVEKLTTELASARSSLEVAMAEVAKSQAALPAMQAANDAATKSLTEAQGVANTKREVSIVLVSASSAAQLAQQKLSTDAELTKVTQDLKSQSDQIAAELPALDARMGELQTAATSASQQLAALQTAITNSTNKTSSLQQTIAALEPQLAAAAEKANADAALQAAAVSEWGEHLTRRFAMASLRPLTPEQMCWSMMQAVGVIDQYRSAAEAELNMASPLSAEAQKDPAQLAARARQVEQTVYERLKGNIPAFVQMFGAGAGQPQDPFFATVDQALFLANGGQVLGWTTPAGGNLADRLMKLEDPAAFGEELYLSVLSRRPSPAEIAEAAQYLASRGTERQAAVGELIWALLTSSEFRFNH